MGQLRACEILLDCSMALVEDIVNTTLNPAGGNVAIGMQTVTPGSMLGIYPGAIVVPDYANPGSEEAVSVVSTTATTFTAVFSKAHTNTAPLVAPTFPSGQLIGDPLFSQAEMLQYLTEAQNDFLLKVQPIYKIGSQVLTVGDSIYPAPADAIRIERISIVTYSGGEPYGEGGYGEGGYGGVSVPIGAVELWDETATGLDWMVPNWFTTQGTDIPKYWYQDKAGPQNFGVGPPSAVSQTATLYYSQLGSTSLGLLSGFLLPDVMSTFLKYRVIALALSKDGETRDDALATHCQRMYDLIVLVSLKFILGIEGRFRQGETVEPLLETMKQGA